MLTPQRLGHADRGLPRPPGRARRRCCQPHRPTYCAVPMPPPWGWQQP